MGKEALVSGIRTSVDQCKVQATSFQHILPLNFPQGGKSLRI